VIDLELVDDSTALWRIESEWEALLSCSDANEPTLSPVWLRAWWQVFGMDDGRVLRACTLRDRGRLVGLVPLLLREHRYRGLVPFRRLELLGSGEDEADEIASDYIGIVAARGYEGAVARRVADTLASRGLGAWDELVCCRMAASRTTVSELAVALGARDTDVTVTRSGECAFVTLPRSWDAYLTALPSNHRYVVRRSLREFDQWAGAHYELETASTLDELARGVDVLHALHAERWNAKRAAGAFASTRFRRFHEIVMPQLLDRGALQLAWLTVRNAPIAVVYNILWNGKVYFYQSGRVLDTPKKVRPGITLHAMLIRQAIERGLSEYDFLGGEAQYKEQLATDRRDLVELRATPRGSVREKARRLVERSVDGLREAASGVQRIRESIRWGHPSVDR
jgi:CelD/BcsL family acetyltransferase involved in cellulose biosynthesis